MYGLKRLNTCGKYTNTPEIEITIRVAPDTDLAGYPEFFFRKKCTLVCNKSAYRSLIHIYI